MSKLKRYSFVDMVERELDVMGVEYVEAESESEVAFREFNAKFLLALNCYMPSIRRNLFLDCKGDIRLFGFDYTRKKWSRFIGNSLTG